MIGQDRNVMKGLEQDTDHRETGQDDHIESAPRMMSAMIGEGGERAFNGQVVGGAGGSSRLPCQGMHEPSTAPPCAGIAKARIMSPKRMRVQRGMKAGNTCRDQKPETRTHKRSGELRPFSTSFSQVIQSGTPSETAKKSFQAVGNGKTKNWLVRLKGRLKVEG